MNFYAFAQTFKLSLTLTPVEQIPNLRRGLIDSPSLKVAYLLIDSKGEIIYVGQSQYTRFTRRLREHIGLGKKFTHFYYLIVEANDRLITQIEDGLIGLIKPIGNKTTIRLENVRLVLDFLECYDQNCKYIEEYYATY